MKDLELVPDSEDEDFDTHRPPVISSIQTANTSDFPLIPAQRPKPRLPDTSLSITSFPNAATAIPGLGAAEDTTIGTFNTTPSAQASTSKRPRPRPVKRTKVDSDPSNIASPYDTYAAPKAPAALSDPSPSTRQIPAPAPSRMDLDFPQTSADRAKMRARPSTTSSSASFPVIPGLDGEDDEIIELTDSEDDFAPSKAKDKSKAKEKERDPSSKKKKKKEKKPKEKERGTDSAKYGSRPTSQDAYVEEDSIYGIPAPKPKPKPKRVRRPSRTPPPPARSDPLFLPDSQDPHPVGPTQGSLATIPIATSDFGLPPSSLALASPASKRDTAMPPPASPMSNFFAGTSSSAGHIPGLAAAGSDDRDELDFISGARGEDGLLGHGLGLGLGEKKKKRPRVEEEDEGEWGAEETKGKSRDKDGAKKRSRADEEEWGGGSPPKKAKKDKAKAKDKDKEGKKKKKPKEKAKELVDEDAGAEGKKGKKPRARAKDKDAFKSTELIADSDDDDAMRMELDLPAPKVTITIPKPKPKPKEKNAPAKQAAPDMADSELSDLESEVEKPTSKKPKAKPAAKKRAVVADSEDEDEPALGLTHLDDGAPKEKENRPSPAPSPPPPSPKASRTPAPKAPKTPAPNAPQTPAPKAPQTPAPKAPHTPAYKMPQTPRTGPVGGAEIRIPKSTGGVSALLNRMRSADSPAGSSSPVPRARVGCYSPWAKSNKTALSKIAPLHPNRKPPPPPPPPPPPKKKTKKEIEMEEQWEMELEDNIPGWYSLTDEERAMHRRAKRDKELGCADWD